MRKRLSMILCIILVLSAIPAAQSALAADGSGIVRVKLSVVTETSLSFFVDGNYSVGGNGAVIERQQYKVRLENGSVNLYCGPVKVCGGASFKLVQHVPTDARNNLIWLYNAHYETTLKYTGDMEFIADTKNGCIQVVNHIYIEDYLYGVVPYEMSDSYPSDALKAQAIAARNYAAKTMGSAGSYDLTDDSSNDQVYRGIPSSATNAIKAVDDTAGQVVTYGDTIIECYYSASNGGWTELPYHRWGGGKDWPYYVIVADPYDTANPATRYETISLPVAIDEAHPITTSQTQNLSGTINADNAVKLIKNEILNSKQLEAYGVSSVDGFTLTGVVDLYTHTYDTDNDQDHSLTQDLDHDGNPDANLCMDKVRAMGTFTVLVGETPVTVTNIDFDLRRLKSNGDYPAFFAADLGMFLVEPVLNEGGSSIAFNLSMKRYGHGVGLSQRGAQQRANSSDETARYYNQILGFYYPGTSITTLAYTKPALTAASSITDHTNASVKLTDATPLNVRSGAGTSSSKLGTLPDKARIEVVQASAATANGYTWHKILFGGQYAYVAVNYVQLDDPQPAPQSLTVAFVANSGSAVGNWTGNHGANIPAAPATSKTGYSFGGWYYDSGLTAQAAFPLIVTDNTTLYAKWNLTSYAINYNLGGGSASNPGSYTINDTVRLNNPSRLGYRFTGWSGTGISGTTSDVTIPAGSTGDRSYTANWVSTGRVVTFNAQGGSDVGGIQRNLGETIATEPETSRPGYDFGGWYPTSACNTDAVSFPYTVSGSVTLYAKWNAQPQSAFLSGVSLSAGSMNRGFSRACYSYKVTLGADEGGLTLTPWRENSTAAMTINGRSVSSYSVSLANGKSTKITVKVKYGKISKTYKFTVTRAKSSDNSLASLSASAGMFDRPFDPNVTTYTLTLDESTKSVRISDTVANPMAKASFKTKAVSLNNGQTKKLVLTVKAQSGARRTYTIIVTRAASTDAGLKLLKTSSGLSPAFNPGVTDYTVTLPANKNAVTISAKAFGYKAVAYIDGAKKASKKVTLANGQSVTVRVTVVAQAGNTREYTITLSRP